MAQCLGMSPSVFASCASVADAPSATFSPTEAAYRLYIGPVGQSWPRGTGSVGDSVGEGTRPWTMYRRCACIATMAV